MTDPGQQVSAAQRQHRHRFSKRNLRPFTFSVLGGHRATGLVKGGPQLEATLRSHRLAEEMTPLQDR